MRPRKQARRAWEPEEEQQLRQMAEAGKRVTIMALRLKRTPWLFGSACIFSRFTFAMTRKTRRARERGKFQCMLLTTRSSRPAKAGSRLVPVGCSEPRPQKAKHGADRTARGLRMRDHGARWHLGVLWDLLAGWRAINQARRNEIACRAAARSGSLPRR
jgi:hypothetical protein